MRSVPEIFTATLFASPADAVKVTMFEARETLAASATAGTAMRRAGAASRAGRTRRLDRERHGEDLWGSVFGE